LVPLIVTALAQVFIWFYALSHIQSDAGQYFLHYNIIFGVDLVGAWWKILMLPIGGLMIIIFNYLISILIYNQDKLIARLLPVFTSVFEIFLAWSIFLIIDINL